MYAGVPSSVPTVVRRCDGVVTRVDPSGSSFAGIACVANIMTTVSSSLPAGRAGSAEVWPETLAIPKSSTFTL